MIFKTSNSQPVHRQSEIDRLTDKPGSRLLLFTRYPCAGTTKTRLIPLLGAAGAAEIQQQMTEHVLSEMAPLQWQGLAEIEVRFTGGTRWQMRRWLSPSWRYCPQGVGDLGDRMARAFGEAFSAGMERVVAIGSDCPQIDTALLASALAALDRADLVLGPALDGGYYLIGMRRFIPDLFQGIDWGTSQVFQQTMTIVGDLDLSLATLPALADVDRPEDLTVWQQIKAQQARSPQISVIIPVLNEAANLEQTLRPLSNAVNVEAIAIDGGSTDGTLERAESLGVKAIRSEPGRACQMNAGAAAASGEILLFLHADTLLPEGFEAIVRATLRQPNTIAGAFRLHIDGQLRGLRAIETLVQWRSQFLHLPYGDQGLFLRTDVFRQLGGFPDVPIMEDFELVRRLGKWGNIAIASAAVLTSARRWQKLGVIRTTAINQAIVLSYFLGVSPTQLVHWYVKKCKIKKN
jgi:rSAM/selenodomain-associated transferase 2/rSAM/selenodomain-associated transferase 1